MSSHYEELANMEIDRANMKNLASAILLSAIEDCDIQFLTDDYEEWKMYRTKKLRKNDVLVEFDYQREFKEKEKFKNCLFDICDLYIRVSDIPDKIRKEREMFERNKMKDLVKLTGYQKETLLNMAKLHGWKIGVDYVEPSMFDDNF